MKVFLDTIGCRLNQSEIELFAGQFHAAGHELVGSAAEADIVVINTCTVTSAAASDSRQKIRQAARSGAAHIVVTGCWASINQGAAAAMDGVQAVISNLQKDHLVGLVLEAPPEQFTDNPVTRITLPGLRHRTRAFIKAQDGCDNHCTFCITRIARGKSRSVPLSQVITAVQSAIDGGTMEVVLTGVQLGAYGKDLDPPQRLADLVRLILANTAVPRLRLSSVEPWEIDESLLACWQDKRMCRHLHLPLQSGSAEVLRRMGRKTTLAEYLKLVNLVRKRVPGIAVTTDIIAGFPGESDAEFRTGLQFIAEMDFADGHVFTYSPRPGTSAAQLHPQVPDAIKKARSAEIRATIANSKNLFCQQFIGGVESVLWESVSGVPAGGWKMVGLTDHYLRVSAHSPVEVWNQIQQVRLLRLDNDMLAGEIVTDQA